MKLNKVFSETLKHFDLTQKQIAEASGVRQATLSQWLRGEQEINTDTLERLITALPPQAQQYLFLNRLISQMDDNAIGTLLYAISLKMRGVVPQEMERLSA
jgi:transcriptional regulator with XRE-family HTH domain